MLPSNPWAGKNWLPLAGDADSPQIPTTPGSAPKRGLFDILPALKRRGFSAWLRLTAFWWVDGSSPTAPEWGLTLAHTPIKDDMSCR